MHREESPQDQISRDLNNSPLDLRPDQDLAGEEEEGGVEPHGVMLCGLMEVQSVTAASDLLSS